MARLIVAVVNNDDAERLVDALRADGHRLTEIPSFGGFFHGENTTLLVGVEDERSEEAVLGILERECTARELDVPDEVRERLGRDAPEHVRSGGATIFLVDLAGVRRV